MKVFSIGRDVTCDIVINDSTDVISRRHAILNVAPSGKMTIVDQSHNGTYVNGIKISPNVPVPVTRKDNVSLAHVARLDWSQVPKPVNVTMYVIIGLLALAAIIGGIILFINRPDKPVVPSETTSTAVDSTEIKKAEEAKKAEELKKAEDAKKAEEAAKAKEMETDTGKKPKPKPDPVKPDPVKKCTTCGKPVDECQYKGKHPEKKEEETTRMHK